MSKLENPVLMATVGAAQGLRGEVRVKTYTADPLALGDYGNLYSADGRLFEILELREAKTVVVVRFRGINDRNAAEALNGLELFVERDNLPDDELDEDEFYYADLEGLEAVDADGKSYGTVSAVFDFAPAIFWNSRVPAAGQRSFPSPRLPCSKSISKAAGSSSIRWLPVSSRIPMKTARGRNSRRRASEPMTSSSATGSSFKATVLTLYPDMFPGHLGASLAGKALERGAWVGRGGADPRFQRGQASYRGRHAGRRWRRHGAEA